jgi:branched-chain amino acid transport system permease protein
MLVNCLLGLSQYVVLRAGVFSVATAGVAAIGAYAAALLHIRAGVPVVLAIAAATVMGAAVSLVLSVPLARLRGVYQAIATLAFVQIVLSLNLAATDLTGGALGLNGIPKWVGFWTLLVATAGALVLLNSISRTSLGRAFDAVRQDETVAVALGIPVARTHAVAFGLSGAIAGLAGGLIAFHSYSLTPEEFGFSMLVAALAFVVLGGNLTAWGPVAGAVVLTALPEVARPLAEQRMLLHGGLLIAVMVFMQHGMVDTLRLACAEFHRRKSASAPSPNPRVIAQGVVAREAGK